MLSAAQMRPLPEFFHGIDDPRDRQGRRHALPTVLALATDATPCGMRGSKAISGWVDDLGPKALERLRVRRRDGQYRTSSLSVMRSVLIRVDPAQLDAALRAWHAVHGAGERPLAIDGKQLPRMRYLERDPAAMPGGENLLGIRKRQTHTERAARRIEDTIDDGYGRRIVATYRRCRLDNSYHSHFNFWKQNDWQKDFDMQGIHSCDRGNVSILMDKFSRRQHPIGNHTTDWTSNCQTFQYYPRPLVLELHDPMLDQFSGQITFCNDQLRHEFIVGVRRHDVLFPQNLPAVHSLANEYNSRLLRLDSRGVGCLHSENLHHRRLVRRIEPCEYLIPLHDIAPVHHHLRDDAYTGTSDFNRFSGFHQAIESHFLSKYRPSSQNCCKRNASQYASIQLFH